MSQKKFFIYTDASFSKSQGLAVIGFSIFNHLQQKVSEAFLQITESNNIRAEIRSALAALQASPKGAKIMLYTDCQNIINLPARREKLENSSFISKSKNQKLANADLYREFYTLYDRVKPELHWIKGHSASKNQSLTQINFSALDKAVRKSLRESLKEHP